MNSHPFKFSQIVCGLKKMAVLVRNSTGSLADNLYKMNYSTLMNLSRQIELNHQSAPHRPPITYQGIMGILEERFETVRAHYKGNMHDVVEVYQAEQAITSACDHRPVLATFGLGPCISLVGYDRHQKIGFLTHYDHAPFARDSFLGLMTALKEVTPSGDFEVRIIGGWEGMSEGILLTLKLEMVKAPYRMTVVDENMLSVTGRTRSIALDTRSGHMFSYNPNDNHLVPSEERAEKIGRFRFGPQVARMAYSCSNLLRLFFEQTMRQSHNLLNK